MRQCSRGFNAIKRKKTNKQCFTIELPKMGVKLFPFSGMEVFTQVHVRRNYPIRRKTKPIVICLHTFFSGFASAPCIYYEFWCVDMFTRLSRVITLTMQPTLENWPRLPSCCLHVTNVKLSEYWHIEKKTIFIFISIHSMWAIHSIWKWFFKKNDCLVLLVMFITTGLVVFLVKLLWQIKRVFKFRCFS